eukprot:4993125-Pleurochrysis_carterae.AAC.3
MARASCEAMACSTAGRSCVSMSACMAATVASACGKRRAALSPRLLRPSRTLAIRAAAPAASPRPCACCDSSSSLLTRSACANVAAALPMRRCASSMSRICPTAPSEVASIALACDSSSSSSCRATDTCSCTDSMSAMI